MGGVDETISGGTTVRLTRRVIGRVLSDQRGVALVLLMAGMVAVLSAAAIAIDVGLLYTARGESRRAAEAAALAGAGWLITAPGDVRHRMKRLERPVKGWAVSSG